MDKILNIGVAAEVKFSADGSCDLFYHIVRDDIYELCELSYEELRSLAATITRVLALTEPDSKEGGER